MSLAPLAAGSTLPPYRVSAQMPADTTENKIHEDGLARELGFRGGLVPGVTVYAWMTHPVVAALGVQWLERDLLLLAEGKRPVAHIMHKAIYQLRASSDEDRSLPSPKRASGPPEVHEARPRPTE